MQIPIIGQKREQASRPVEVKVGMQGDIILLQLIYDGLHVHVAPMDVDYAEALRGALGEAIERISPVRQAAHAKGQLRIQI